MQILDQKLDTISLDVPKPPLTTPKEFHFATDERLGPAAASVFDQFEKVSLGYTFLQLKFIFSIYFFT
jgi:hypothetical protein